MPAGKQKKIYTYIQVYDVADDIAVFMTTYTYSYFYMRFVVRSISDIYLLSLSLLTYYTYFCYYS